MLMELFVTSAIIVLLALLSARQIVNIAHGIGHPRLRVRLSLSVLVSSGFFLFTECLNRSVMPEMVVLGLVIALSALLPSSFTLPTDKMVKSCSVVVIVVDILLSVINLIDCFVPTSFLHEDRPMLVYGIMIGVTWVTAIYIYSVIHRLKDLKYVMKAGSQWSMVCICVDSLYMVIFLITAYLSVYAGLYICYAIGLSLLLTAASYRIMNSSAFVLWTDHENRIIESMKISHLDVMNESPGVDLLYKSIYDRVLEYFEEKRPYLNNALTINDIVEIVFTNKVYISRAISHYTGRNFCQFVNYYRVSYAVELFRENPHLKIVEMASLSGFNSAVSFSTAFRLFMGEKPGDWCRKERCRLDKQKK